jgi:hypothetical protein
MIEMTWGQIRDMELSAALNGLARQRVPYATTLKILTISKAIEAEQKKADEMATIIRDKYMKKSEDGKTWELKDKALEDELKTAEKDFVTTKFKIRSNKLKSVDLSGTELTAVELFKLENLVEFEGDQKPESHLKPVEGNA